MRNKLLLLAAVMPLLFSGCIVWDGGYTANGPVRTYAAPADQRVPLTFQLTLEMTGSGHYGEPTVNDLQERISLALRQTGLFSEVKYGTPAEGDKGYYVQFAFKQAGMNQDDDSDVAAMSLALLFCVPTFSISTFDASATLIRQDKPIYSTVKAEELRTMYWLPLIPAGFFLNDWTGWDAVKQGAVNALVNDIARSVSANRP